MSDDAAPDLSLITRQQRQILTDLGAIRDDLSVLMAIAMRQEATLMASLTEVRAIRSQRAPLVDRVRALVTHEG